MEKILAIACSEIDQNQLIGHMPIGDVIIISHFFGGVLALLDEQQPSVQTTTFQYEILQALRSLRQDDALFRKKDSVSVLLAGSLGCQCLHTLLPDIEISHLDSFQAEGVIKALLCNGGTQIERLLLQSKKCTPDFRYLVV